ncbi:GntR family transcriptional regulator [Nocardioides carbamazepini]|uniref:GntR family transcriptional regulator n=1 Tax=Nocardioides carbamazepini TaxID=2854259 RepID=UPI00214A60E6|nr:GntR family transcriptional regulator [Nocardioides carbamazepini]MCR1786088.1 GntR family transcriptional regulator [Nocardioides carbamazepini]
MSATTPARSMTGRAYQDLRASLLDGRLRPNQRLVEMDLVSTLGVNRAAVREALARLEQEGLVERRPNRGVVVREISPEESRDVLDMRIALESMAVRWASARRTPDQAERLGRLLAEMAECCAARDVVAFADRQAQIHHLILDMAHAPPLAAVLRSLSAHVAQIRRRSLGSPHRLEDSLAEHRQIVSALLDADADRAAVLMAEHLETVRSLIDA